VNEGHRTPRVVDFAHPGRTHGRCETGLHGWRAVGELVIAACAISMLVVQMDWFALNLAISAIAKHFDVASTDLQWLHALDRARSW
jgi:hypothetical protein